MALLTRSVLVTGSNRGIGLELVRQLAEMTDPPEHIFATCRNPKGAKGKALHDLADKHPNIHVVQLEVENQSSVESAMPVVESHLKGKGLNLLINNAGVNSYATLQTVERQEMLSVFSTNVEFLPLLRRAANEVGTEEMSCNKAAIINVTSKLASIERGFEAALNMVTVCLAMEVKADGILCTLIHPGWMKTDMGTDQVYIQCAPLTVQDSVKSILKVLATLSSSSTGAFLDWEGKRLP
ncbi:hypothetical protein JD844_000304, partial [Phrynosoma platyrhinos]